VFIETAAQLVGDACGDAGYTEAKLELIERWLSCHFYRVAAPATASEKADVVSENFQYKLGLNLNVTMYGQNALALDTAGGLARVSQQAEKGNVKTASIFWLGKDE